MDPPPKKKTALGTLNQLRQHNSWKLLTFYNQKFPQTKQLLNALQKNYNLNPRDRWLFKFFITFYKGKIFGGDDLQESVTIAELSIFNEDDIHALNNTGLNNIPPSVTATNIVTKCQTSETGF